MRPVASATTTAEPSGVKAKTHAPAAGRRCSRPGGSAKAGPAARGSRRSVRANMGEYQANRGQGRCQLVAGWGGAGFACPPAHGNLPTRFGELDEQQSGNFLVVIAEMPDGKRVGKI